MWIFTKHGFYSICENKGNPDLLHIRTQFPQDLEYMREVSLPYSPSEITETPLGDYRYRLDISREGWKYFLNKEMADIDYTKFKPAVVDKSTNRKEAYLTVFNEMMRVGRECAYERYIEETKEK